MNIMNPEKADQTVLTYVCGTRKDSNRPVSSSVPKPLYTSKLGGKEGPSLRFNVP